MIAWRLSKAKHRDTALTGEGAAKFPGRWNGLGRPIVYLGEHRSTAALELLAHTEDLAILADIEWIVIPVEFDDRLVAILDNLPADWAAIPAPASTRAVGDRWFDFRKSLVLRVPSLASRGEHNFLLNPLHADFTKIVVGNQEPYAFDRRISRAR